mmetsp:Transcript_18799/g.52391  ORF Transcript_18799/g.52391 Transcript_18799/m.52391 type:complete len:1108 (-) Transcript_18799:16-3339(-)
MKQTGISRFFSKAPKKGRGDDVKTPPEGKGTTPGFPVAQPNGQRVEANLPAGAGKRPQPAVDGASLPPQQEALKRARTDSSTNREENPTTSVDLTVSPCPDSSHSHEELCGSADGDKPAVPSAAAGPKGNREGAPGIPARDSSKHAALQKKLVDNGMVGQESSRPGKGSADGTTGPLPGAKLTPLEQQVVELKRKYPGVILLVEVGYKMRFFGDDAEVAARVCNVVCHPDKNFLTAYIPVPRIHVHVRRLVRAGYKVGVVRQTESAALKAVSTNKHGPFVREMSALYTPATLDAGDIETGGLSSTSNAADDEDQDRLSSSNFLLAILDEPTSAVTANVAVVAVDCMSGKVHTALLEEGASRSGLEAVLLQTCPAELLLSDAMTSGTEKLLAAWMGGTAESGRSGGGARVERFMRERRAGTARASVASFFADHPASLSCGDTVLQLEDLVVEGLSHVIAYLRAFSMDSVLAQKACFQPLKNPGEMSLTPNCLVHLEVLQNSDDGGQRGSLLWLVSQALTRGGSRLLRHWTTHPLTDLAAINARLDAVGQFQRMFSLPGDNRLLPKLPEVLMAIPDLEVGVTRLLHHTASPSEAFRVLCAFGGMANQLGLAAAADRAGGQCQLRALGVESELLRELLKQATDPDVETVALSMLAGLSKQAAEEDDLINLITDAERFPEVFKCHEDVKAAEKGMTDVLADIRKELQRPSLAYTEIQHQGKYLIELPTDAKAPAGWVKVCSTKKVDRYLPPTVKEGIARLEQAQERRHRTCKDAWSAFLDDFSKHYCTFRAAAAAVSHIDALLALGQVSSGDGFCRPQFVDKSHAPRILIKGGRHPMLNALLPSGCVANDTTLAADGQGHSAMLVTGPNMGGKSCFIRQSALLVIMAQMGCYVPAESCELHVVDCIYTRMGASDNLAAGRSTFQVELTETSHILANATERSLVIVDELGRGTSTHDGVAIASATLEHLLTSQRCLTLFVTHYPQLGKLCSKYPSHLGAYFMDYTQDTQGGEAKKQSAVPRITFLYKLAPGVVESSFGMNVAALAGLPPSVVARAAKRATDIEQELSGRKHSERLSREIREVMESSQGEEGASTSRLKAMQLSARQLLQDLC